jgi:hypothetical protein
MNETTTENNNTETTVPAIREDVVSTLTDAEIQEYYRRMTDKYKPEFAFLNEFRADFGLQGSPASLRGYIGNYKGSVFGYGRNFEEAVAELRKQVGANSAIAEKKRAEAARLIAEADALEGASRT